MQQQDNGEIQLITCLSKKLHKLTSQLCFAQSIKWNHCWCFTDPKQLTDLEVWSEDDLRSLQVTMQVRKNFAFGKHINN